MTDIELIKERLRMLETYIKKLEEYGRFDLREIKASLDEQWKIERGLHLAIECVLDMGSHIIADDNLGNPREYREIMEILGSSGVVTPQLAKDMEGLGGFRNILVHEYGKLNLEKVYEYLQKSPQQFRAFAKDILKYIK